jgi:cytidine deaminase
MFMMKIGDSERRLLDAALKAMRNAHVLWGLRVSAAVLADDGHVYEGCSIESWVSGLGTCAERCAINHAVLHGNRKISARDLLSSCFRFLRFFSKLSEQMQRNCPNLLIALNPLAKVS